MRPKRLRAALIQSIEILTVILTLTIGSRAVAAEDVLYSFAGGSDGAAPEAGMTFDKVGNLYGTTENGGGTGCYGHYGCGTVFELSPISGGWNETVLYRFSGGTDGAYPHAVLTFDSAGNLYGTTTNGGTGACFESCGTVFELIRSQRGWKQKVLYSFTGGADGAFPVGRLVFDGAGDLYGVTTVGGSTACSGGCGTVFKLIPSKGTWKETVLHSFTGGNDGEHPENVIFGLGGELYGATENGGQGTCTGTYNGCGTIYRLRHSKDTWTETVLHSFQESKGVYPSELISDVSGNIYGTTYYNAPSSGCGVAFKLAARPRGHWQYEIITNFQSGDCNPSSAALTFDSGGNLFGTAGGQVPEQYGVVVELQLTDPVGNQWRDTVLYNFTGRNDGAYPHSTLILDQVGILYGTTGEAGAYSAGVAFEITR